MHKLCFQNPLTGSLVLCLSLAGCGGGGYFGDKPDAWGNAQAEFGQGLDSVVTTTGASFGPERARNQLKASLDALQATADEHNRGKTSVHQHIGIVPQREPHVAWRANEFKDMGYAVMDIDRTTGAPRWPQLRFGDDGSVFGIDPADITPELRRMLYLENSPGFRPLDAYMFHSAMQRGALAPVWEVQTAKLQSQRGAPNAGLSEEERAANTGHAAPLDTAYAAAHPHIPAARNKRVGTFMVVGLDLNGDWNISARPLVDTASRGITFDWDGQSSLKHTGWIDAEDGFLVLDHNANDSVDDVKELFGNPLIADSGKGLRVLAAYDANGDGRIDASDPVFTYLRVWRDLNQDGRSGPMELRTMTEASILAIDWANGRCTLVGGAVRSARTVRLEAEVAR